MIDLDFWRLHGLFCLPLPSSSFPLPFFLLISFFSSCFDKFLGSWLGFEVLAESHLREKRRMAFACIFLDLAIFFLSLCFVLGREIHRGGGFVFHFCFSFYHLAYKNQLAFISLSHLVLVVFAIQCIIQVVLVELFC